MMRRLSTLLALAAAWLTLAAQPALAANLTPDELTQAVSASNTDLMLIYPSGGPLKSIQWSVVKSLMQAALGSVYLQTGNNLSDVASASTSRNNLGLGTAAVANTGTSGANLPFLNGANTWGAHQIWVAGTTSEYPFGFQPGVLLTSPVAGAFEWDGTSGYLTKTSGPTREKLAYADGSNLAANAVALSNLATQAANTIVANATGSTAAPTAVSMPSCSGTGNALNWTAGTGPGCVTHVTTTGSPATGNLTKFSAAGTITNADLTGDVTTSGTVATTIAANAVTNAKMATMGASTTKCNATGGSAVPTDCSVSTMATLLGGTASGTLAAGNDSRFAGPTQNGQCSYTLVLGDAGKQIYCNTATGHTLTIPANASVAYATGVKIDVVNDCSAGALTISITSDTLVWFPSGGTGSRTLAACGEATLSKVNSTRWVITGTGLT